MADSSISAWFQAPTCASLGLTLEMRLRNTARVHGSGARQGAAVRLLVDLRAYRRGELVYSNEAFGEVAPDGALVVREADLGLPPAASGSTEDEVLLLARVRREGGEGFASQEHHLVYTHLTSRTQAHLLYDQQPVRPPGAAPAPIVFLMPKIWIGADIATYVVVCNTWEVPQPRRQPEPVRFALLDERGAEVCSWDYTFFYNQARAFDLRARIGGAVGARPRFFNLVGRGGASAFVLFAIVRNLRSNHFAVEHSLPPIYYMDGPMAAVRSQGCDPALIGRRPAA